ncbi:MAG: SH3 domain-containing protein [Anaerolineae bacterium]
MNRRTDIYALGVVIYELLTGDVPFRRTTPLATVHAQVYDPPPPLREKRPELPPSVESVVLRALAKNPGGRYRDVTGLASDLSRAITGQLPVGLPEGSDEQAALADATVAAPAPRPPRAPSATAGPLTPAAGPALPASPPLHPRRPASPWLWMAIALAVLALGAGALAAAGVFRPSPPAVAVAMTPDTIALSTPTASVSAASQAATVTVSFGAASGQGMMTDTAVAAKKTPTRTPVAIATSTPLLATATVPLAAQAEVIGDVLNVRSGPGTEYALIGQIRRGDTYPVVGRDASGAWWQICCVAGDAGWVANNLVRVSGAMDVVAVVEASTPTTTPTMLQAPSSTMQFVLLSLADAANANIDSGYVDPPLDSVTLAGVPFDLGAGESVTTQANPLPANPRSVTLAVDVANPQTVYLLLTGGNVFKSFDGQKIGQVLLVFDNGSTYLIDLTVGYNIREWKQFGQDTIVTKTSSDLSEVWRGANRHDTGQAVIDMLAIALPAALQGQRLVKIDLVDRSHETVGSLDPAINWLGATVRVAGTAPAEPVIVTPAPTPTFTSTPMPPTLTPTPCASTVGPTFARVWQRQQIGCPVSSETGVTSAYEAFEHGFMLWRKDVEQPFRPLRRWRIQPFFLSTGRPGGLRLPGGGSARPAAPRLQPGLVRISRSAPAHRQRTG